MARSPWRVMARIALLSLGLSITLDPPARAGDAALAEFLLKAGRDALEKGDLDDAFSKLSKAMEESLHDFEVQYWLGLVCEKRQDHTLAVGYYRLFLRNVENATKASVLPAHYQPLAKKARARLEVLAAASAERGRLDEGLAAKLVALARKHQASQPEVAKRAARWAWRLVGDTEAVLRLLADLDEDPRPRESKGLPDPEDALVEQVEVRKAFTDLPEVTQGRSVLYERLFGAFPDWSWKQGVVTIDLPDSGHLCWPAVEQTIGARFVVETEVRLLEERGPRWGFGVALGSRDRFLAVFLAKNQVVVVLGTAGGGLQDVTGVGLPPFDARSWQRLSVRGDGAKLTVWLEGKPVIEHTLAAPFVATTGLGLWYQQGRYELRTLRQGRLP